ncbi:putative reverse transcriptase zinc-binding domain-containing protein [Helianthus annuus]|nr:putative reverse transcriptase zinc-binding domain-containing protein [Helianthus annuus]
MKAVLAESYCASVPFILEWNNWVPLKVNIMAWKSEIGRLPTLMALRSKDVHVGSVVCKLCGSEEESSEHLFTSCFFASHVWQAVAAWCKVSPIYAFSIKDLLMAHKEQRMDRRLKKVFNGVLMTVCWGIWKARNEAVFFGATVNVAKTITMEDIK